MHKPVKDKKSLKKSPTLAAPESRFLKEWYLLGVLLITLIAFFPALNNGFTNWDDEGYVLKNYLIQDLSFANLKNFFSENVQSNFHPFTMLSYAVEYHFFQLNPKPYHITNLVLHLLNAALVFTFIYHLLRSRLMSIGIEKKSSSLLPANSKVPLISATITSLLFGIHPMHVESVAWVSERKDVLYGFFFLLSLIFYLFYATKEKNKSLNYLLAITFFICSLLSKGMAVSLSVVLLAIDFFLRRNFSLKLFMEKIPFFLLSITFGIIAIYFQKSTEAIQDSNLFAYYERILFACYGVIMYLLKLIIPFHLSTYYPYPLYVNGHLPFEFYLAPLGILALAFFIYKRFKTTHKQEPGSIWASEKNSYVLFGIAFFLITIFFVLQLLPVGSTIISDRYTYLPYIGIFFIVGQSFSNYSQSKNPKQASVKTIFLLVLIIYSIAMVFATRMRCVVWKNSFNLWEDVIKNYPQVSVAHTNLGLAYKKLGDKDNEHKISYYEKALTGYNKAIEVDPNYKDAYENRGNLFFLTQKYDLAMQDLHKALQLKSTSSVAHNSLGAVYFSIGKYDSALVHFNEAIKNDSQLSDAYKNRGNTYSILSRFDEAIIDYNRFLKFEPQDAPPYYWRGLAYQNTGKLDEAIIDFDKALQHGFNAADLYLNRSKIYFDKKNFKQALNDVLQGQSMGMKVDENYINKIREAAGN